MSDHLTFSTESSADLAEIDTVHRLAFGQEGESKLVRALREHELFPAELSIVAKLGKRAIGHVLFSELMIEHEEGALKALALAPVAVLPEYQRKGVGSRLIRLGLIRAQELGYSAVLVLGDPRYYARFGFKLELGARVKCVYNGSHFMGLELKPAALSGLRDAKVTYPAPFSMV